MVIMLKQLENQYLFKYILGEPCCCHKMFIFSNLKGNIFGVLLRTGKLHDSLVNPPPGLNYVNAQFAPVSSNGSVIVEIVVSGYYIWFPF